MQYHFIMAAAYILLALTGVRSDLCSIGATEIEGNWYCQPVDAIRYNNVGTRGSYNQVTSMNADGSCSSKPKSFGGPLAPLDEEVSLHFRGPLKLKQLAVYAPSISSKSKPVTAGSPARRHRHRHRHLNHHVHRHVKAEEIGYGELKREEVTATIDGKVVSWENNWYGGATNTPNSPLSKTPSAPQQEVTATIDGKVVSWVNDWFGGGTKATPVTDSGCTELSNLEDAGLTPNSVAANGPNMEASYKAPTASSPPSDSVVQSSSSFTRIGYYDSASQTLDNLAFLGNHGGQGSGVFDFVFGASLAYSNCNGTGGAASPQFLAETTIPSNAEVIVMLGQECVDGECGFVRDGAIAHHGFVGPDKIFLIEFSMPMDGITGFNGDMPAIWILNAQIPRTLQYGNAACSCWESGCGEFDIAEALHPGSQYLKSTLHSNTPGGDSDYFIRPTSTTMKLAIIFSSSTSSVHIQVLPDSMDFSSSLTADEINRIYEPSAGSRVSDFAIS